jgi:hypothetical protein
MSRMYSVCTSVKPKALAMSADRAAALSAEARIFAMILSIMSRALRRPSTMCARSLAFLRRNSDRRRMTSI